MFHYLILQGLQFSLLSHFYAQQGLHVSEDYHLLSTEPVLEEVAGHTVVSGG